MMYLRILILSFLFMPSIATSLAIPFLALFIICGILSKISYKNGKSNSDSLSDNQNIQNNKNPLEFKTALLFGLLFVIFGMITNYVMKSYGNSGITSLAFVVGITDIDPFLLNLLQGTGGIAESTIALAIINATTSNNLLKMIYATTLCSKVIRKSLFIDFSILIITGALLSILCYLL